MTGHTTGDPLGQDVFPDGLHVDIETGAVGQVDVFEVVAEITFGTPPPGLVFVLGKDKPVGRSQKVPIVFPLIHDASSTGNGEKRKPQQYKKCV